MEISEAARALAAKMNDCCGSCVICPPEVSDICDEDAMFAQQKLNEASAIKDVEIERFRNESEAMQSIVADKYEEIADLRDVLEEILCRVEEHARFHEETWDGDVFEMCKQLRKVLAGGDE